MSFITDLLDALKNKPNKTLVSPEALSFPTIDLDELERSVDLQVNAQLNGENNLPKSDENDLDFTQQQIIEKTLSASRPFQDTYTVQLTAYNSRLEVLNPEIFRVNIQKYATQKKSEIKMISEESKNEIYSFKMNLLERSAGYKKFKERHDNPADPIERFPVIVKYAILLALVILEGFINNAFLGDYMKGGDWEGLGYALGVPIFSIVFCGILAGTSLRKLSAAKGVIVVGHILMIVIATILSLATTLFLASLRLAVDMDMGDAQYSNYAWKIWLGYLSLNPLPHDFNIPSALLIALGMAFFIISAFDIKSLDHPIPGFLQAYKAREKAVDEYRAEMERLNEKLRSVANARNGISEAFENLQAWQTQFENILRNKNTLTSKYTQYIEHIVIQVNTLLSKYRNINQRHRSTPPPEYFKTRWSYKELNVEQIDVDSLTKTFKKKLISVNKISEEIQKEIDIEIAKLSGLIKPIEDVLYEGA